MQVALLCDLPIGVLAWEAPEPTLTVIVKATFALPEEGKAHLAEQHEPLTLDQPSAIGAPDDLERPSDFVPFKTNADVLVAGNAYSASPSRVIAAGFAVDGLKKRFFAHAAEPTTWAPLLPSYLRAEPSSDSEVVRVGPRSIAPRAGADREILSEQGLPRGPLPKGFDYAAFNVAPPDQQPRILSSSAQLVLDGLVPGGHRRAIKLPGLRPRVFALLDGHAAMSSSLQEVSLRADTLCIDGGLERCTLTFRGLYVPSGGAVPLFVLALDGRGRSLAIAEIRRRIDGAFLTTAITPEDLDEQAIDDLPTASHGPPGGLRREPPGDPSPDPRAGAATPGRRSPTL